jgi:benzoyl-CoA reductase/2-hydroxyglutaryl-CoA dehydratase subunit BcrC/BadD/HgdB
VPALQAAEDNLFSRDSCSYQRAGLGAGLDGHLPHPIALVGTTHICDGVGKVYAHIGRRYGLEPILVDVPYQYSQEGVSHLEKQLWNVIERLSEAKGEPLDQDKLVDVVRRSNQIRERMLRVSELRKLSPSPWHGREPFDFTFLSYMIWGTEELLTIYDHLIEQLEDRVANPPPQKERSRILWLHAMPYHKTKLMHLLEEEHGAHIVFEELSTVYWEEIDEREPVRSLAEKMLRWPGAGPVENRVQNARRLAEEYRVDGAIHFSHWGCRQGCGGVRVLKDSLMELDVPLLNLDGDGIDSRTYSPGQEKTRVEGFLEMLG